MVVVEWKGSDIAVDEKWKDKTLSPTNLFTWPMWNSNEGHIAS